VDLVGLAKRGVRLGYTPDVLNDAGGCDYYASICDPYKGYWKTPLELSLGLHSGRSFCHVGLNGWSEWWEGSSVCEERRGRVPGASQGWTLDPAESGCLVAGHILVSLWLVWTPIEWHHRWSEEDGRVSRVRKNRASDS
jgi:hypothetical protein